MNEAAPRKGRPHNSFYSMVDELNRRAAGIGPAKPCVCAGGAYVIPITARW